MHGAGLLVICGLLLSAPSGNSHAQAPTIKLFPTTVIEEIKHTSNIASEMETGLQSVIKRLDQQQKLYTDSKCDGNDGDPGCDAIAQQLSATYLSMLEVMGEKLPEMEAAINTTSNSLEKRIRKELGHKRSAWSLQELLLDDKEVKGKTAQPSLRGRSGMRLSDRFNQYYKLVSRPGSRADSSLAVVASDIYLDMQEASRLIARTREEINRATLMGQLNQSFGVVTPEMQEIVVGVKTILFGEGDESLPSAEAVGTRPVQDYESPLQL